MSVGGCDPRGVGLVGLVRLVCWEWTSSGLGVNMSLGWGGVGGNHTECGRSVEECQHQCNVLSFPYKIHR